ncbi:hypothetical protein [Alistipes putredinis]|uniref:hypothetical protein n=1 Tax=Alistipes putredinis TaxID=28117 RepID=UPI003AB84E34
MYCDKDSSDRYSIVEIEADQLETIRRALIAYRTGMIQHRRSIGFKIDIEPQRQYDCAGAILKQIEYIQPK